MLRLLGVSFALFLGYKTSFCQGFLSSVKYKTRYIGMACCQGKLETWSAKNETYLKKSNKNKSTDTLEFKVYFDSFFHLNSLSGNNGKREMQNRILKKDDLLMSLKIVGNTVFLFRPEKTEDEWLYKYDFPVEKAEIINLEDTVGTVRDGSYFFESWDYFSITLKSKTYNVTLRDTLYHYAINSRTSVSHGVVVSGFLFSKIYGFLRWDYRGSVPSCQTFLIDGRWKEALLTEIRCDKF